MIRMTAFRTDPRRAQGARPEVVLSGAPALSPSSYRGSSGGRGGHADRRGNFASSWDDLDASDGKPLLRVRPARRPEEGTRAGENRPGKSGNRRFRWSIVERA